jgi:multiple sugar transport system ATP-binding protein
MSDVRLQNITKRFKIVTALKNVSFNIEDGEFFVLLGPTGAGKTTTLRTIAGLERQDEGQVLFDGESVDDLAPPDRDVAFVFQQYSLYPTMSVYDNLAFPLRSPLLRTPEDEVKERVGQAAEILRISHLLERKTAHLSGGEMQRVSLGRAIVRQPRIYLMDEPLSNLDAKLRESLRVELKHIQKTQNSTTLFVTHDQVEALTMSDRIGVLNLGRIIQIGTPKDIYDRPISTFVAQLVGIPHINLVLARCEDGNLTVGGSHLSLPKPCADTVPETLLLGIRPEHVQPQEQGEFEGKIVLMEPLGVETIVHIQTGEQVLLSTVPGLVSYQIGQQIRFDISRDHLHYFTEDGARIEA